MHEHRFIPTATGCTMVDIVEFRAPLGPLGWIVERLVLGRTLRRLIDTRNEELLSAASLARAPYLDDRRSARPGR